jgi:hypothetical protein
MGRIAMGKKYRGGTDVMVKAFTKRWELLGAYELLLQKNVVFIFLYGPRPKLHLW